MLDDIIQGGLNDLMDALKRREPDIIAALERFILLMDSKGGNLLANANNETLIAYLEIYLQQVLKSLGLGEDVTKFLSTYNEAESYVLKLQSQYNEIKALPIGVDKYREFIIRQTVDDLLGSGLTQKFAKPIMYALARSVYAGGGLRDVLREVRTLAESDKQTGNGLLMRHYIQVSRDAAGQYAGNIHNIIAQQYGFDELEYVGSLVKDSRAQCIRWVGMERIKIIDLKEEINWAERNGSGLIPGTTPDNFIVNRGGYNCTHEGIPVRSLKRQI